MQILDDVRKAPWEQAGYFKVSGAHLGTVLHRVTNPIARVLLVGPFASERHQSYGPWVRWARYLAACNMEVLRYDYRGVGESTGVFREMTFAHWIDDVQQLAGWLQQQSPLIPTILHGLEVGALLAAAAFATGRADALLLWSPPASANHALRSTLMRWTRQKHMCTRAEERIPAAEYMRQLEGGGTLEVEGYRWTSRLWRSSFCLELPAWLADGESAVASLSRPARMVRLERSAVPLAKASSVGYEPPKDFDSLFAENHAWIAAAAASMMRGAQ